MTKKYQRIIVGILVLIPPGLGLFIQPKSWLAYLSNAYFYIAGPILIVSLFGAVLKDGTFDLFAYSMKKYGQRLFNPTKAKADVEAGSEPDGDDEEEKQAKLHQLSRSIGTWYRTGLKIGFFFLLLSVGFVVLYLLL